MRKLTRSTAGIPIALGLMLVFTTGCEEEPIDTIEPLPVKPQVQASAAFVTFGVVAASGSAKKDVIFLNGGQDDLVFTNIEIVGNPGTFDIDRIEPADMTAGSRQAVTATIIFEPNQRGVSMAQLVATSNAENSPVLELEIVGPAQAQFFPGGPDLLLFEDTAVVVEDVPLVVTEEIDGEEVQTIVDTDIAFVRFINVGDESVAIGGYAIDPTDGRYGFAVGMSEPTIDVPVPLAPGTFAVVSVLYDAALTGDSVATFTITSYDYADVTYPEPDFVRTVPPNALVTTDVTLTTE